MIMAIIMMISFFLFHIIHLLYSSTVTVTTKCGEIKGGKVDEKYSYFLGIPFAEPPVGDLRFQPPQKIEPKKEFEGRCWPETIYDATYSREICSQMGEGGKLIGREDCLYLDIYIPLSSGTRKTDFLLPVFVWIYGGGLFTGQGSDNPFYGSPRTLSEKNGVVVVSLNYRLGPLGWLTLEELSENDQRGQNVSGNYGLLDVIETLEWIQENIESFSGDPRNVNILGQSSGGTLILGLSTTPFAKGLYSTAISMSGSPILNGTLEESYVINYDTVVSKSECRGIPRGEELLNCLYEDVSLETLYSIESSNPSFNMEGSTSIPQINRPEWYPLMVIDGYTLPYSFSESMNLGKFNKDSNLVFGVMREEVDIGPGDIIVNFTEPQYNQYMKDKFSEGIGEQVVELYPYHDFDSSPQQAYDQIATDVNVICDNLELARLASKHHPEGIFFYISPQKPSEKICSVVLDNNFEGYCIQYAFHCFDSICAFGDSKTFLPFLHKPDFYYGDVIRELFVNFSISQKKKRSILEEEEEEAENGLIDWIPFGKDENVLWLETSSNLEVIKNPRIEKCKFWERNGFESWAWIN